VYSQNSRALTSLPGVLDWPAMAGNRAEQKQRTRRAIIDAALRLSAEIGFGAVSLRQVARAAGIAPNSFYRHFRDMDALALTLIDEVGTSFRQLMRAARRRREDGDSVVESSVAAFMDFQKDHGNLFRLLLEGRAGGSVVLRSALQNLTTQFVEELTVDLESEGIRRRLPLAHTKLVAEAMVTLVLNLGAAALENEASPTSEIADRMILHLRIILRGAQAFAADWQPEDHAP